MPQQILFLHAECIERTDHRLLPLDLMHDKYRNHIGKQHQHNDARNQSDIAVHDDITGSGCDPRIIRRRHKCRQVVDIEIKDFIEQIVSLRFEFCGTVCKLCGALCSFCCTVGIIADAAAEFCNAVKASFQRDQVFGMRRFNQRIKRICVVFVCQFNLLLHCRKSSICLVEIRLKQRIGCRIQIITCIVQLPESVGELSCTVIQIAHAVLNLAALVKEFVDRLLKIAVFNFCIIEFQIADLLLECIIIRAAAEPVSVGIFLCFLPALIADLRILRIGYKHQAEGIMLDCGIAEF